MLLTVLFLLVIFDSTYCLVGDNGSSVSVYKSVDKLQECDKNAVPFYLHHKANNTSSLIHEEIEDQRFDNVPKIIHQWTQFPYNYLRNYSMLSKKCVKGLRKLAMGLRHNEIWALKMFDATAKLPSGVLSGNINQFGDYDECLSVQEAQYCLAEVNLDPVQGEPYRSVRDLVHSYFPFKGTFDDPQHRVPDFSAIRWGVCTPSECTSDDLEEFLRTNFNVNVKIRKSMCKRSNATDPVTFGHYFARFFFMALLLAIIISTIITQFIGEAQSYRESKWFSLLLCFSLQNSWRQLTQIEKPAHGATKNDDKKKIKNTAGNEEIEAVHGIRALSALALLMCHKSVALMYNPYINRTATIENFGKAWTVIGRTAIVHTDSFMLLSGLLTTNSLLKDVRTSGSIKFSEKIVNRIFRLLPNIAALILFCTYILPNVSSGPLWPMVVEHHATLCKQYMWRNLLFVHNYFGFENMCLTHTHQVGIDMQLFVITYLFSFMSLNKKWVFFISGLAWILSTVLRYVATVRNELSHMVYFGSPIQQMFDTANYSYILPTHRATIYITGIFLAYILKRKLLINKWEATFWWIAALTCGVLAIFGPFHMAQRGYIYNKQDAGIYGAISPILWGVCLSWVIIASNNGCAGWLGDLLSWKGFKYFTKIAYSFYLVQFPVFFYNVGIQRTSSRYSTLELLHYSETTVILVLSVVLTVCIEIPFQLVEKVLLKSRKGTSSPVCGKRMVS